MRGSKIKLLKKAMVKLIESLHNGDKLCIVKFSGQSEIIFDLKEITTESISDFQLLFFDFLISH